MKQMLITSLAGKWGSVTFFPSQMLRPLASSTVSSTSTLGHTNLIFTDKAGAAIPDVAQPYGYDYWIGSVGSNKYRRYKVKGSKITIAFVPSEGSEGGVQMYGGFSTLTGQDDNYGMKFSTKYSNVDELEVSDFLNTGIAKNPKLIQHGGSGHGGISQVFTFNYSQKRYAAWLKKSGVNPETASAPDSWFGSHGDTPEILPEVRFLLADVGTSTTATVYNVMVIQDYIVELSDLRIGGEDVA